jgi:2-keto-4-pentenoate hydratase
MLDIADSAARQLSDRDARTPGTMFAEHFSLSEDEAYAIQAEVCRLREQRGESVVGYKIGCTSTSIQQQLHIDHPVFGRLFDSERWPTGTSLESSQFCGLAIEGELAVRLSRDLSADELTDAEVLAAIESVFPIIELHHLVFRRSERTAEELIANNAIHAGFVFPANSSVEFDIEPATLRIDINDEPVATVSGTELTRTVVDSIRWLSRELHSHGRGLLTGQTILCGSVADLFPISSKCRIVVTTDRFGSVECTIDEETG